MELYTGSAVSVVSEGVYQEYLVHFALKDTSLKLRTNTVESVKPLRVLSHDRGLPETVRRAPDLCDEKRKTHPIWQRIAGVG